MILTELPVEIMAIIFTYLDTKSKINVCNIAQLRHFFTPCVLKKMDISRSTLASPKTLDLAFFQTFAANIQELNLSGIKDLTSAVLSKHMHRFTNLKTLDVTFTEISLSDLQDICCESLKNVNINYFQHPWNHARDKIWMKTIEVFKRQKFESIHFVVLDFDYSDSPYKFMEDVPMIKDVKITLAHSYKKQFWAVKGFPMYYLLRDNVGEMTDIHFEKFAYNIRDCGLAEIIPDSTALLRKLFNLDYTKIEYIFIMYSKTKTIFISVSPIIHSIFKDPQNYCNDLSIDVSPRLALNFKLDGNIFFKAWNKATTDFDDVFFNNLLVEFKDYFPTYICTKTKETINITKTSSHWYCLDNCNFEETVHKLPENISFSDCCRSLDDDEADRNGFNHKWSPTTLAIEAKNNVTFLSFTNICSFDDSFGVLFKECKRLRTLDVNFKCYYNMKDHNCSALRVLDSLHLTKSLRNLRILTESVKYFHRVFDALSSCQTLENVHISEASSFFEYNSDEYDVLERADIGQNVSSLIEKCCNLYSFFIQANMEKNALITLEDSMKFAARKFGRDYLHIKICCSNGGWNPFADVFSPSHLHIKN